MDVLTNDIDGSIHKKTRAEREERNLLVRWRIGNIGIHQACQKCNGELSRLHALECASLDDRSVRTALEMEFPNVTTPLKGTIMDGVINEFRKRIPKRVVKTLAKCIEAIRVQCMEYNPTLKPAKIIRASEMNRGATGHFRTRKKGIG
jgi:excinuclease UvrABC ATPase subunit